MTPTRVARRVRQAASTSQRTSGPDGPGWSRPGSSPAGEEVDHEGAPDHCGVSRTRSLGSALCAAALTATLCTSCAGTTTSSASPAAAPATFQKNRDSNYGQIGDVRLLHVHIATPPAEGWPAGATVALHLTLANDGEARATVVAASTPAAQRVALSTGAGDPGAVLLSAAPRSTVSLQEGDPTHLVVVGLTSVLRGGLSVPVTFTLDTGESVTLAVPAQISREPATRSR